MEFRATRLAAAIAITLLVGVGLAREAGASPGARITEVHLLPDVVALRQSIEITNFTSTPLDLGGWRLRSGDAWYSVPAATVIPAHGTLQLVGRDGVDRDGVQHMGTEFPDMGQASGSVALFAPGATWDARSMMDFVQWGAPNQILAPTAAAAGLWDAESFCPGFSAVGISLQYCGPAFGVDPWIQDHHSLGQYNPCLFAPTPVQATSWGSLKARFDR